MSEGARRPAYRGLLTNLLYGRVLQYREIRYLWVSTLFIGTAWGETVVLGWVLLELTDSPLIVGLGLGLRMAPSLFVGILAGAIADRTDRRAMMKLMGFGLVLINLGLGLILLTDAIAVWHLLTLTVVAGCMWSLQQISRQSFTFDIAGPTMIVSSLAFISLAMRIGGVGGSLMAGYAVAQLGADWAYFAIAGGYLLSVIPLFMIRSRGQAAPVSRQSVWQSLKEFGSEVRLNRSLRTIFVLVALVEVLGFSHMAVLPSLARDVIGVNAEGLGVMNAFSSVGGFLAITLMSAWGEPGRKGLGWLLVLLLFGAAIVGLGAASTFLMAILAITLVSGMTALSDVFSQGLMQSVVPNELRGRAMGSWNVAIGIMPIGSLQIGALASATTVGFALMTNGLGLLVLALGAFALVSTLRRL